jgi:hypothetical protein
MQNTSTTTCTVVGSSTECVTNSIDTGEALIAFFLFLILSLFFFKVVADRLVGIRKVIQEIYP